MEPVKIAADDRFILAKFTVNGEPNVAPFYVLNLYAPANNVRQVRIKFFKSLKDFLLSLEPHIMSHMVSWRITWRRTQ
jgi:hypothetical protein